MADIHFHYKRAHRGGRGGRRLPAHQSRQYRQRRAGARGGAGGQGPRLLHAHRRQCRLLEKDLLEKYGEPCPEAMVESALDHATHPAGPRLPRIQDQREGVATCSWPSPPTSSSPTPRLPAASRHHRGRRPAHRHGQVVDRPGLAAVGRHRRHRSASRCRPSPRKRCGSASSS